MKDYIEERAVAIANYIIDHNATVRQTAKSFGISKSTVHKDCTERLISINPALAAQTRVVLDLNKSERHIRGGMAQGRNTSIGLPSAAGMRSDFYPSAACRTSIRVSFNARAALE